eukprot:9171902-Heterocapsa_arctica.AAC.1
MAAGNDPYFVKSNEDIVRLYVYNNVPSETDNFVTAFPADDDEEGAMEVPKLQQGDLVPGNVGGLEEP